MIDLQTLLILQEITIFVTFGLFLWAWIRADHVKADCKTEVEELEKHHKHFLDNLDSRLLELETMRKKYVVDYVELNDGIIDKLEQLKHNTQDGMEFLQERILALEAAYSDTLKTFSGRICDLERDVEKLEKGKP
jgi:predicted transcriptional regulator